jgi:hypothetical protein
MRGDPHDQVVADHADGHALNFRRVVLAGYPLAVC